jgi:hypothetical protein
MTEIQRFLVAVERINAALAALVLVVGLAWRGFGADAMGLVAGLGLAAVNFRALVWVARRIASGSDASRAAYTMVFVAKLGLLMAACYMLVVVAQIAVLPFLAGLSTMPAALMIGAWRWMQELGREPQSL